MISQQVLSTLNEHSQIYPMLQDSIDHITQSYKEKLWHQLTDYLLEYTGQRVFDDRTDLISLYNVLIKDLTLRVNPLKYALITVNVARQFQDLEEAITFLNEAKNRLQGKQDATFILQIAVAEKRLQLGQHHDGFEILTEVKMNTEFLSDVDPKVYANLSKAFATYYRRKEDHENFYKSTLQFLAYTPPQDLTQEEKKDWSIKLGMAVLLGKNIYNITELLDKDILHSLVGSDFEWLYELLQTLGKGQIAEFERAVEKHQDYIYRFQNILQQVTHLKQKVRIISFLELLFTVDKDDRSLKFDRIAHHTHLDKLDVELLVMKAMSLELIKGTIDEVEELVHVDWILPRYLNKGHIEIMVRKLNDWEGKMEHVIRQVEGSSDALLIQNH